MGCNLVLTCDRCGKVMKSSTWDKIHFYRLAFDSCTPDYYICSECKKVLIKDFMKNNQLSK